MRNDIFKKFLTGILAASMVLTMPAGVLGDENDAISISAQDAESIFVTPDQEETQDGSSDIFHDAEEPGESSVTAEQAEQTVSEESGAEASAATYEAEKSDQEADTETKEDWEATLPEKLVHVEKAKKDKKVTEADIRADMVSIAESQKGYQESEKNYILNASEEDPEETVKAFYNRYGVWYEEPYADPWDLEFAEFVMYYAGIEADDAFDEDTLNARIPKESYDENDRLVTPADPTNEKLLARITGDEQIVIEKKLSSGGSLSDDELKAALEAAAKARAEKTTVPFDDDTVYWTWKLASEGRLLAPSYKAKAGDIVFLKEEDGTFHAAVVTDRVKEYPDDLVVTKDDPKLKVEKLVLIGATVGEVRDEVREWKVETEDESIWAYGKVVTEEKEDLAGTDAGQKVSEEEIAPEKSSGSEAATDPDKADEESPQKIEAEEPVVIEKEQTLQAVVYTNGRKVRTTTKTAITLSGLLPEGGYAEAYPVKVEIPGQEVVAAFDITIYDNYGREWEPSDPAKNPITVSMTGDAVAALEEPAAEDGETGENAETSIREETEGAAGTVDVYHMDNINAEPELVESSVEVAEGAVAFEAERFSIYVIVARKDLADINSVADIEEKVAYHFSITRDMATATEYMTNIEMTNSTAGLGKSTSLKNASEFFFEKAPSEEKYYIYTIKDGGKKYFTFSHVANNDGAHLKLSNTVEDEACAASVIPIKKTVNGKQYTFYVIKWENKNINQFNTFGGDRFACWKDEKNTDVGGHLLITRADAVRDPLGIDGKMFIIVYNNNTAMTATVSGNGLGTVAVTKNNDGTYTDTDEAPAAAWMFHANDDGTYQISTVVEGNTKYLSLSSSNLTLSDTPHAFTLDNGNTNANGLVFFGEENKVRIRYVKNVFERYYLNNAPGNNADQNLTLGQLSSIVSYDVVVPVPVDGSETVENVKLSSTGEPYVADMKVAAPPQDQLVYFPDENSNEGWMYRFVCWEDENGNEYNVGENILRKYMSYKGLTEEPVLMNLKLTSKCEQVNTEKMPIYTVINHLDGSSQYVLSGEHYNFNSNISDLTAQTIEFPGTGKNYSTTTDPIFINGAYWINDGGEISMDHISFNENNGEIAVAVDSVTRDYEFFPTYSQAVGNETTGTYQFMVALNNSWMELARPFYADYYTFGIATTDRYAWQNAYLRNVYSAFYNENYSQYDQALYSFGHNAKDTNTSYNRMSINGFTCFFERKNTENPKYIFYTPVTSGTGDQIKFAIKDKTDNIAPESFYTITLSDELEEEYEESELISRGSLITGKDVALNKELLKLEAAQFAKEDDQKKVRLHNACSFNKREITVQVTAPEKYADTDLSIESDTAPRLMLVSVGQSETIRIAPDSWDKDTNTYTYTIPAEKMICPYEAKILTRDPLNIDKKSRMIINESESIAVAMNTTAGSNKLGGDIVTLQNDRYDTGVNVLPTLWTFEVAGDGNGLYTIKQGDKYLNIDTGTGNNYKNLTLGAEPQVFYMKADENGKVSICATTGPGAYLHYRGSEFKFQGYYSNQTTQPDLSERFVLGLPLYDIYYTYPKAESPAEGDTDEVNNRPTGYYGEVWSENYTAAQPRVESYTSMKEKNSWVYAFTEWKPEGSEAESVYKAGNPVNKPEDLLVLEAQWQYNSEKSSEALVVRYVINPADNAAIKQDYPLPTVEQKLDYSDFVFDKIYQNNYTVKSLDGDRTYYKTYTGLNENQNTYVFAGWKDENDTIHSAEDILDLTQINEEEKLILDADGDGVITLTATWNSKYHNNERRRVFFYVDKSAVSSQANSDASFAISTESKDFTNPAFCTLMEYSKDSAPTKFNMGDYATAFPLVYFWDTTTNNTNSYNAVTAHIGEYSEEKGYGLVKNLSDANTAVRRLEDGVTVVDASTKREQSFKLLEFPSDEQILSFLRDNFSTKQGDKQNVTLDGESVDPDTLTTDYYTIKWYICKYQMAPGGSDWHIDGKLTPKASYLTVRKIFSGDEDALSKVEVTNTTGETEEQFYIQAENTNKNTDYGRRNQYKLILAPESEVEKLPEVQKQKEEDSEHWYDYGLRGYSDYDANTHTYIWSMRVRAMSQYKITEHNYDVNVDGTEFGVAAQYNMTHAKTTEREAYTDPYRQWISDLSSFSQFVDVDYLKNDVSLEQRNMLNLYNSYVEKGTFMLHAVGLIPNGTGTPEEKDLSNTFFKISAEDGSPVGVTETAAGKYTVEMRETEGSNVNEIKTDSLGRIYLKMPISVEKDRSFIITETVPSGYMTSTEEASPAFKVTAKTDGTFELYVIKAPEGGSITALTSGVGSDSGNVTGALIKNAAQKVNVKVSKEWDCLPSMQASSVTMQLTGKTTSRTVFTKQAVLSAGNNWTYTWEELPKYYNANLSQKITYSVEEIKIGDKSKGSTAFKEWSISYEQDEQDDNGNTVQLGWTVKNTNAGAIKIELNKIDAESAEELTGYQFEYYEQVPTEGEESGKETKTISFNGENVTVYDSPMAVKERSQKMNLDVNRTYYLQETKAPKKYAGKEDFIKIEVNAEGKVTLTREPDSAWKDDDVSYEIDEHNALMGTLTLKNRPAICRIVTEGKEVLFASLHDAMDFAKKLTGENVSIEMLVDYTVPQTDSLTGDYAINDKNITLTTALEGENTYEGSGNAKITRGFKDGSMFEVTGKTFTLQNIVLDGNRHSFSTAATGGIVNVNAGSLSLGEGATLQNSVTTGNGGAVYVAGGAALNVNAGRIANNTAASGGAVYCEGTCNISGGTITGNRAANGSAVALAGSAVMNMSGGTISGNTSTNAEGGAVAFINDEVQLVLSGAPVIYANFNEYTKQQQNVMLNRDTNAIIRADGLTGGEDSMIGVYVPEGSLWEEHGDHGKPFGTFMNGNTANLNVFYNDSMAKLRGTAGTEQNQIIWDYAEKTSFTVEKIWTKNGQKIDPNDESLKDRKVYFELNKVTGGSGGKKFEHPYTVLPEDLLVSDKAVWPYDSIDSITKSDDPAVHFTPSKGVFYYDSNDNDYDGWYAILVEKDLNAVHWVDHKEYYAQGPGINELTTSTTTVKITGYIDFDAHYELHKDDHASSADGKIYYNQNGKWCIRNAEKGYVIKYNDVYYATWNLTDNPLAEKEDGTKSGQPGKEWYSIKGASGSGSGSATPPVIDYSTQGGAEGLEQSLSQYKVEPVSSDTSQPVGSADNHGIPTEEVTFTEVDSNGNEKTVTKNLYVIDSNDTEWTKVITNLDAEASYYVIEWRITDIDKNGETYEMPIIHQSGESGTFEVTYAYRQIPASAIITNDLIQGDGTEIGFTKIGSDEEKLGGAEFALYSDYQAAKNDTEDSRVELEEDEDFVNTEEKTAVSSERDVDKGTVKFTVANEVYFMKELNTLAGYKKNDNIYLVLAGADYMTYDELPEEVLNYFRDFTKEQTQTMLKAQNDANDLFTDAEKKGYAIFLLEEKETGPVVVESDITNYGLLNENAAEKKVMLEKTDTRYDSLTGAQFDIYNVDWTLREGFTSSAGMDWLGKLPVGKYYLHEKKFPDGHERVDEREYFVLHVEADKTYITYKDNSNMPYTRDELENKVIVQTSGAGKMTGGKKEEKPEVTISYAIEGLSDKYYSGDTASLSLKKTTTSKYSDGRETVNTETIEGVTWSAAPDNVVEITGSSVAFKEVSEQTEVTFSATLSDGTRVGKTATTKILPTTYAVIGLNDEYLAGKEATAQLVRNGKTISATRWESDKPNVATVSSAGKVEFQNVDSETTVTIKGYDGDNSAQKTVVVKPNKAKVTIVESGPYKVGDVIHFKLTDAEGHTASTQYVAWAMSATTNPSGYLDYNTGGSTTLLKGGKNIEITVSMIHENSGTGVAVGTSGTISIDIEDKVEVNLETNSLTANCNNKLNIDS